MTQPEWQPSFNPWLIALAVMAATFMEILDTTVTNVSLPHIAGNLSASVDEATWVLTSYLVSNAIILPATGWLSSYFGRKRFLMACIGIFTFSSMLCGLAPNLGFLVLARVIQGVGGGALQPISQAVLMESFPPAKRGLAAAVYGIGVVVAPIIGPTLGGWITDNYSWRWIFYINLPVGTLSLLMTYLVIEDPPYIKAGAPGRIDYLGFGLMAVGLGCTQLMLDKGQEEDWFSSALICWLAAIAAISLVSFIIVELRTREPIVDLHVFANRNFAIGTLLMTVVGVVLFGITALLPLYLQNLMGYPAMQSGMAISPRGFGSICALIIISRLITRLDNRLFIGFGFALMAFSSYSLSRIDLDISVGTVVWPNILNGVALGCIFVPLTALAMGTLSNKEMGNATGIFNLMRNLGASLGISVLATMLARGSQRHQALMVHYMNPYSPSYRVQLQAIQQNFGRAADPYTAQLQALYTMSGKLIQQATLMSFLDCFRVLAVLSLACVPLVFLFKRVKASGRQAAMH